MMRTNSQTLAGIEAGVIRELTDRPEIDLDKVHVWVRDETVAVAMAAPAAGFAMNEMPVDAVPVLVQLHPDQNWTHECEIRLHHADGGALLAVTRSLLPPADFYLNRSAYRLVRGADPFPLWDKPDDVIERPDTPLIGPDAVPGERYALLFAGMSNNRHLNDLEYLYRVLIDRYGWNPANITVLNYDGSVNYSGAPNPIGNWPGDNTPYRIHVDGMGTPAALADAFGMNGARLQAGDLFLIHTNNHGGGQPDDPQAWICCYPNWGSYDVTQYGLAIAALPRISSLIVMMEQCHSGGYEDATIRNSQAARTSFAAACEFDKNSMGGADFDPFAHDWILAADDAANSAAAAFGNANASKVPGDSPVYADRPNGAGIGQFLA